MQLNVLGIDYGTVRIGLAKAVATIAEPMKIIPNDKKMYEAISKVCEDENIDLVVIGISENEMKKKTEKFAGDLEEKIPIPIVFFDETLSSHDVKQKLKSKGIKKSKRKQNIDHYAAAEILQAWLDDRSQMCDCSTCPMAGSCH